MVTPWEFFVPQVPANGDEEGVDECGDGAECVETLCDEPGAGVALCELELGPLCMLKLDALCVFELGALCVFELAPLGDESALSADCEFVPWGKGVEFVVALDRAGARPRRIAS